MTTLPRKPMASATAPPDPGLVGAVRPDPNVTRARLLAEYGTPTMVGWRNRNTVVMRHTSEASAQAFARENAETYGHLVTVERDGGGWLEVIDMSAAIASHESAVRPEFR